MTNARVRSYGVAVVATVVVLVFSLLLRSVTESQPFLLFFAAVAFSAGIGGLGPGLLAMVLSVIFIDYFFIQPDSFLNFTPPEFIRILVFALVALVVSTFYDLRKRAEDVAFEQREWLRITLTSIGDAVISTDEHGKISLINPVAESLTGWRLAEAVGKDIGEVFHIVNEQSGQPVPNPVDRVLREGRIVRLANHT